MGKAKKGKGRGKGKPSKAPARVGTVVSGAVLQKSLDDAHRDAESFKRQAAKLRAEARALSDPDGGVVDLARASVLMAQARELMTRAVALDVEIVAAHGAYIEREAVAAGIKARAGLEAARIGVPVKAEAVRGAEVKRLSSVDGLEAMKLEPALRQAGMAYRDLFRSAQPAWASPLAALGGAGRGAIDSGALGVARCRQGQRQRLVTALHLRIARTEGMTPAHLKVLIAIAGEGQTMRQFAGPGGRRFSEASTQLRHVLKVVLDIMTPSRTETRVAFFDPP